MRGWPRYCYGTVAPNGYCSVMNGIKNGFFFSLGNIIVTAAQFLMQARVRVSVGLGFLGSYPYL